MTASKLGRQLFRSDSSLISTSSTCSSITDKEADIDAESSGSSYSIGGDISPSQYARSILQIINLP